MNTMLKNKRPLWLCSRDDSVDYEKYDTPIKKLFNYRATSSEAQIVNTGELGVRYFTIKDTNKAINDIKVGDKFYINEPNLETFNDICVDADLIVVSKDLGLDFGTLVLKSLVGNN